MPAAIKNGQDGADYEACLMSLKDRGDARYGICMRSYQAHHMKNKKGDWVRKKGHAKNKKGEWMIFNFAGFDDYIPIFRGGKQIDSQGIEHDGNGLIDRAVQLFDPGKHEPPVVVGHPKDNSPAFGWVEGLKSVVQKLADGSKAKVLLAKFRNVVPEFSSAVQQGLYKKRSASFYPDGRLRHVGFLGGMPPAVKGLADLEFQDNDGAPIVFGEQEIEQINFSGGSWGFERVARIMQRVRDYFIESKGAKKADTIVSSDDLQSLYEEASLVNDQFSRMQERIDKIEVNVQPETGSAYAEPAKSKPAVIPLSEKEGAMPKSFTEDELQAHLQAERDRLTAEFAEKEAQDKAIIEAAKLAEAQKAKDFEDQKKALKAEIEAEFAEKARLKEIADFISSGLTSGKIIPAWKKMGLAQFMEALPATQVIEFGEGDGKKSETPYDFFRRFMAELPKTVSFSEVATRATDVGTNAGTASVELSKLTDQIMQNNPKMAYSAAFTEAQRQNPGLTQEYIQEVQQVN